MNTQITVDQATTILRRKSVPPGQATLYKRLLEERELSYDELAEQIRWSDKQSLKGVLGALGRRVNATDSTPKLGIRALLRVRHSGGTNHYSLLEPTATALRREAKLLKFLEGREVGEIRGQSSNGRCVWFRWE